jgi:hypothetical protein
MQDITVVFDGLLALSVALFTYVEDCIRGYFSEVR